MHQERALAEQALQLATLAGGWVDKKGKAMIPKWSILDLVVNRQENEQAREEELIREIEEYRMRFGRN